MFQRKQPAESTVSFDLPLSVANIDDESDNSPGGHLQKSRNSGLSTEKLFKKKISSRLLHHDELQQNSEHPRKSESSIKLILDQHHPHSKHNVKIFSTGTPIISTRSVYDLDRRKATMKYILQSTGHSFEAIPDNRNNYEDNNLFYDRIGADAATTTTFGKSNKMGFASNIREKVNRPSTASLFSNNEQSRIGSKIVLNKADNVGKNHHIHNDDYNDCLFSSKTIQEKSKMKNEKMKAKHFDISEKRKQVISFPNEELSIQHNVTEKLFNNWTGMEDRMAINRNRNLGDKNHYNRPDMRRPWTTHSMAIPHTSQSPSYKERSLGKKYSSGKERSFQRSCDVTRDAEFHQLSKTLFESNNKINSSSNLRANISAGSVHNETKSDNKSITDHGDGNLNQIHRNGDYETITLFQSTNSQKLRDNLAHGNQATFSKQRTRKEKLIYDTGCQSIHACYSSEMKEKEKEVMERDDMIEKEKRTGSDEVGVNEDEGTEERKERELANLVKNKTGDISNRNMSDGLYGILSVPGLFDLLGPQNVYRSHASLTYTADKRFQKAVEEVDLSSGIKTDNLGKWMESAAIQKVKFYTPGPRMKFY